MAKTFRVTLPCGEVAQRTSQNRTYTHAVLVTRNMNLPAGYSWGEDIPVKPRVFGWCGSLELAQKQAATLRAKRINLSGWGRKAVKGDLLYTEVTVVPVEA